MKQFDDLLSGKKVVEPTPFGSVVLIWRCVNGAPKVMRVLLSKPSMSAEKRARMLYLNARETSCKEVDSLAKKIQAFLRGGVVEFSLDIADWRQCSEFQQKVLRAEYQIPRGSVSTYRLIAHHLGKQNGARAVGNALARNPFPLIVPCHRAVRSDGSLGGFQGGLEMKRILLEKEGIIFDDKKHLLCPRFHYAEGKDISLRRF